MSNIKESSAECRMSNVEYQVLNQKNQRRIKYYIQKSKVKGQKSKIESRESNNREVGLYTRDS